ncbi:hypothetical protein BB559_000518 [Furculomyces boomerangus]|uniref:Proteasome assembly chaperone 2 n=2 Tax=Harpellales TaxID=61421 RepID=A0A2T9Z536_9FUNG|nr:hypothetical protein BB559_000518 [Furculomyces boomerangus]PVZ97674.1 hypothetical protein BB558_006349 [Smittium angustum]
MYFKNDQESKPFSESILVLPAVSIGNVPQLSVDLIISTAQLLRIGALESEFVCSLYGKGAYSHCKQYPSLALEVYQTQDGKYTFVQSRTPPLKGMKKLFAKQIIDFYQKNKFKDLVLLASGNAALCDDLVLDGPKAKVFRIGNENSEFCLNLEKNGIPLVNLYSGSASLKLEKMEISDTKSSSIENKMETDDLQLKKITKDNFINSGISRCIITECVKNDKTASILLMFVNEGDNVPEAIVYSSMVNAATGILDGHAGIEWIPPPSWELLQPGRTPQELFY